MIHFLRDQGLATTEIIKRLGLDQDNELRDSLEIELRQAYSENQAAGLDFGVLSLAARNDSALMWAHYADSCEGMCIGISIDTERVSSSELIPLWVNYAEELPVIDANKFFDHSPANVMEMLGLFYGTKYKAWEYESELRLVSTRGDVALEVPGDIVEVIIGEKADAEEAQKVYEALKGTGAKLFRMMREPGTWNYKAYGDTV